MNRLRIAFAAFAAFALLVCLPAGSQTAEGIVPAASGRDADLRYIGDTTRVGIGYDSKTHLRGEAWHVFGEDSRSAWIGELWGGDFSTGGLGLSYQWRPADADRGTGVRKLFGAFDQGRYRDRKITAGAGYESASWFGTLSGAAGVSGRRQVDFRSATTTSTITGNDNGRPFEQDVLTTVETRQFERAYDYGVGIRAGRFYEGPLLRLELGADYEWGRSSARQTTASIAIEKFFANTPHSVALSAEAYRKEGEFETSRNDQRVTATYRYAFGGPSYRPAKEVRMVQVEIPAAPPPPPAAAKPAETPKPRLETRLVKTTASAASDAFFDFDRAGLRPDALAALFVLAGRLKATPFEGNVRIVGHTCDIGKPAYNQKLSERRANVVREYLVAHGVPADRLLAEGVGMREPRFPNDESGRPRNRRVDIEFVTIEEKSVQVEQPSPPAPAPAPAVAAATAKPSLEWRREEIESEPAWLRRALRNAPQHKRAVDVYRSQTTSTSVALGERRFLNRAPGAVADSFSVNWDSTANLLDVLANDSDPDGDPLTITAVGAPAHGAASIAGSKVSYTPAAGYSGADAFTYTIADAKGATSSSGVTISVLKVNRAPLALADRFTVNGNSGANALDVLANDSDPDGDPLTITAVAAPAHGTATIAGNKVSYTPTAGFVGTDTFSYTVGDGKGASASATITIDVLRPNRAPVANDDLLVIAYRSSGSINVLANDSDPDGDPLTIVSFTAPQSNSALISRSANGTLLYEPQNSWYGFDYFKYTVSDGRGGTATAGVSVLVQGPGGPVVILPPNVPSPPIPHP